jgi:hypothetical protein
MGTLGDAAIYNSRKTQDALNHGVLGLFVGVEWRKGIMECTFTFRLAQRRCQINYSRLHCVGTKNRQRKAS